MEEYDSRTQDHLNSLTDFADNFKKIIPGILEKAPRYDRVKATLLFWEEGDPDMSKEAKELETIFKTKYGYETESFAISSKAADMVLYDYLISQIRDISSMERNNLWIVYYGGHGYRDSNSKKKYWMPSLKLDDKMVESSDDEEPHFIQMDGLQVMLRSANCDIQLIFDCCYSLAMLDDDFKCKRRAWLLAAAANNEKTRGLGTTYTYALTEELKDLSQSGGVSCTQINDILTRSEKMVKKYKLKATPHVRAYSNKKYLGPISLRMHKDNKIDTQDTIPAESGLSTQAILTDARMLIKIAFKNPADKLREDLWSYWFSSRPPNFSDVQIAIWKQIDVVGFFPSNSTMLLVTTPVSLWAFFPPHPALECIGMVRSRTMMTIPQMEPPKTTDILA